MCREDFALAGARFHDQRAGDVLAHVEIAGAVVRHAVALVARVAHLDDAALGSPAAADVARHVAEIEALLLGIPDWTFAEAEPSTNPFDVRFAIDDAQQVRVVDFDRIRGVGHHHTPHHHRGREKCHSGADWLCNDN